MIDTTEQTTCLACGAPLIQIAGRGHRRRLYCDDTCRQRAHRAKGQQPGGNVTVVTNDDLQQRIAELESELARYRAIVDVSDRQGMIAQFMLTGEEIGYKALASVDVRPGPHAWYAFSQTADTEHLAAAIVAARNVYKQLADLRTTTEVAQLNALVADLRQKLRECEKRKQS